MARDKKSSRKSRLERHLAVLGAAMCSLALILSVSRCSPLAPSISKNASIPDGAAQLGSGPVHVFRYQTVLVHADTPDSLPGAQAATDETRVRLNESQFNEFRATGRTELELPLPKAPDMGRGIFKIGLNRDQIDQSQLSAFESDLRPNAQGKWTLSVPATANTEVSQLVRESLLEVSVSLSVDSGN